jgi:hypothetical protein
VAHGPAGRALRGRLFRWSRSHTNRSSNSIAQAISGANAATTGESGNLHTQQAVADRLLLIQRDDASLLTLTRAVDDAGLPVVPVVGLHDGVARLRGIGRCSVVVVPVSLVLDGPNPDGAPSSSDGSINTLNRLTRDAAPGKIVALIDRPISGVRPASSSMRVFSHLLTPIRWASTSRNWCARFAPHDRRFLMVNPLRAPPNCIPAQPTRATPWSVKVR